VSKINLEKLLHNKIKEDCFEGICKIPSLPFFQYKEIMKLRKDVLKIKQLETGLITEYILKKLNYKNYLEEYCNKYKIDKVDMDEIVEEFNQSISNFDSIVDFLEHLKKVEDELSKPKTEEKDAVLMSTIHSVKGMEFKDVYIINCVQGNLPYCRGDRENDIEEERRLFYVGITRAKENLYLSMPSYIRGKSRAVSPFIEECGIANLIDPTEEYELGDIVQHISFGDGIVVSLNNDNIGIKFKDNITRHFDINKLISHNLLKKMA
jgi:DNA helicase-2/ATP-dependent DNA helicase PcrA